MGTKTKKDYTQEELEALLHKVSFDLSIHERAKKYCYILKGTSYIENPLKGGPSEEETLRIFIKKFDCVTFTEAIIALSLSTTLEQFETYIKNLRYHEGKVDYFKRKHYLSDWISANANEGFIEKILLPSNQLRIEKKLTILKTLPSYSATIKGHSCETVSKYATLLKSGDVICFISDEENLDYFHVGLLVMEGNHILLAHASKSRGCVVIEPINAFLKKWFPPGVTLVRPSIKKE